MKHFEAKYCAAGDYWQIHSYGCYMGKVFMRFGDAYFSPAAEGEYDEAADCIFAQSPNLTREFAIDLAYFMRDGAQQ